MQGLCGTRRKLGLDAEDARRALRGAQRHRKAADQPAAPDAAEDRGDIGHVFQDLEAERSVPLHQGCVVIGRHIDEPLRLDLRHASRKGFGGVLAVKDDLAAIAPRRRDLRGVAASGIAITARVRRSRRVGEPLRRVAGREGDHASAKIGFLHREQAIEHAARLERAYLLEQLGLEEDIAAHLVRKGRRLEERRPGHMGADTLMSRLKARQIMHLDSLIGVVLVK